jgi:hypothetical protein
VQSSYLLCNRKVAKKTRPAFPIHNCALPVFRRIRPMSALAYRRLRKGRFTEGISVLLLTEIGRQEPVGPPPAPNESSRRCVQLIVATL